MDSWKHQLLHSLPFAELKGDVLKYDNFTAKLISFNQEIDEKETVDFFIHQFWWESKPEILISRIKSKFGISQHRIFGRKLKTKKIDLPTSKVFINENHLMGWGGGQISYALFVQDEIIAVGVFSKGRKMKYESPPYVSAELIRFACKKGVHAVGGLDKLVQHYFRIKAVDEIITSVDKDWSNGSSFARIGFELMGDSGAMCFGYDPQLHQRVPISHPSKKLIINSLGSIKMRIRKTN